MAIINQRLNPDESKHSSGLELCDNTSDKVVVTEAHDNKPSFPKDTTMDSGCKECGEQVSGEKTNLDFEIPNPYSDDKVGELSKRMTEKTLCDSQQLQEAPRMKHKAIEQLENENLLSEPVKGELLEEEDRKLLSIVDSRNAVIHHTMALNSADESEHLNERNPIPDESDLSLLSPQASFSSTLIGDTFGSNESFSVLDDSWKTSFLSVLDNL
jgi:hypothetical protein